MYHEIKSYELLKKENISLTTDEKKLSYNAFILGDFIVSFGLSLKSGEITGEMCLHGGGTPAYIFDFVSNEVYTRYNKQYVTTLSEERTEFSVLYSVTRRRFDIYVNGEKRVENYYAESGIPINCDKLADFFMTFASATESAEIELTDLRAHSTAAKVEGAVVYDETNDYYKREKKIVLTDKNYLPREDDDVELLKGAIALHMRSGVIYRDGRKTEPTSLPRYSDDAMLVYARDLFTVLDKEEREAVEPIVSPSGYVDISEAAKALSRQIYYNNTTIHYGMVILTKDEFNPPCDNKALQKLNDFLFYFRPSKEKLYGDYTASSLAGVHPRLLGTDKDFERIRKEIRENSHKARWFKKLIEFCDGMKDKEILKYELRDGVRLLYVSWDLQLYAVTLALAYKLTGDRKYFDYAWPHLKAAAEMPDWNPSHHIDVGTLAYGFAIAYDWFYDVMDEEQKAIMEKGAYENLFYTVNRAIEDKDTAYTTVLMSNNHNVFSNAGVMATVIAFMDVYPEIASKIGADIIRVLECFMDKFAPKGAYYEGPYYAETAINYTVRVFASMLPTLGTLYGLDKAQGFDGLADFIVLLQSDVASFNFADSQMSLLAISGMFWLFDHYGRRGIKDTVASDNFRDPPISMVSEALIWYNVEDEGCACDLDTVVHYPEEEIITMRDSYRKGQTFVGVKAGNTVYAHSHLDAGSFILDAMGKRWAYDLGQDNYNLYYKYNHWDVYRLRAESHNTLVINPDRTPGYVLGSRADVVEFVETPSKVKAVVRMSDLFGKERGVEKAMRAYLFTDERSSLVIRDEVTLTRESLIRWHMCTRADIEIDGKRAILRDKNEPDKYITVEFSASCDIELGSERALPLPTSPDVPPQNKNEGFYRLYCKAVCDGNFILTVKINTKGIDLSPISDYDKSMDTWQL